MLENEDIDIVSICTESGYHSKQAIYCMNKGKHVIVEKPIALSIQDADKMIKVAKVKNVKLCVSHQNRFNPVIQLLWNAIEQERFGKLIGGNARILWSRSQDYYKQASWRGTYELDGGCLMNQCIHNIDLLQWMMGGKIRWVSGAVNNYSHPNIEVEDYGSIQMEFENGAIGNVEGTVCVTGGNLEETLTIIGEKGFVSIGGVAVNKIESWRFDDGLDKEENIMAEFNQEVESIYGEGHSMLYKNFVESIENNIEPYINGEEAIASMQIILASYKSNQEGRRIIFPVNNISTKDFRLKNNNKSL
jgi:predicted dehydrogenase